MAGAHSASGWRLTLELVFIAGDKIAIFLWRPFHPRAKARGNSAHGNSARGDSISKNIILRFLQPVISRSSDYRDNKEALLAWRGFLASLGMTFHDGKDSFPTKGDWNVKPDTDKKFPITNSPAERGISQ